MDFSLHFCSPFIKSMSVLKSACHWAGREGRGEWSAVGGRSSLTLQTCRRNENKEPGRRASLANILEFYFWNSSCNILLGGLGLKVRTPLVSGFLGDLLPHTLSESIAPWPAWGLFSSGSITLSIVHCVTHDVHLVLIYENEDGSLCVCSQTLLCRFLCGLCSSAFACVIWLLCTWPGGDLRALQGAQLLPN